MRDHNSGWFPPPASRDTKLGAEGNRDTWGASQGEQLPPRHQVGDVVGDFTLGSLLGRGSSGYVHRATDRRTGRECAVKLIGALDAESLVRLKLGFRRMMTLQHRHLVGVDRMQQLDGTLVLAMDLVEGQTLAHHIRGLFSRPREDAYRHLVALTRDYASALARMHACGYVHRDVKPANLMVDREGRGVVIDYGLVGTFDPESDPNGVRSYLVGTPTYVAPEVLWNQFHGPASDIFSLGLVTLESVQAVAGAQALRRREGNRAEDREFLGNLVDGMSESIPELLRGVCAEMLEFDPADRPTAMQIARLGRTTDLLQPPETEGRLYGREQELREIDAWVDHVFSGGHARLHITGRPGIGKSRLVRELVDRIEAKRWGQVFFARCQRREDQPMQVFGQFTDAIVARYGRDDRETLRLDPVSHSILTMAFPALRAVVEPDLRRPPIRQTATRLDALEAASRMSVELRKVGPLFLVIDDVQWADRDSLNVLDRLQTLADGMLGLVTVSRDGADPQRVPPTREISLRPLDIRAGLHMLSDAAARWSASWSASPDVRLLEQLVESTEGCPWRLHELSDEFRPGGLLSGGEDGTFVSSVDELWGRRLSQLSEDALLVLRYVATAGRPVSIEQLGQLSEQPETVEAAVSELVRQRLVTDEATGGECISVMHDSVTDRIVAGLGDQKRRDAHERWALLLMRGPAPDRLAARIARHLIDAGQPGRAVSYSILAAEDAERRLATTEAGFWHKRVIPFVGGAERVERIRRAAQCFEDANRPDEAARLYKRLAELVDESERFECEMRIAVLLTRAGRWDEVRVRLASLANDLGTPRPRSPWIARWSLRLRGFWLSTKRQELSRFAHDGLAAAAADVGHPRPPAEKTRRMRLCLALDRPMSMFDNLLGAELNLIGTIDAIRFGTPAEKGYAAIGSAVISCYDQGRNRTFGERLLRDLEQPIRRLGDRKLLADHAAGMAYAHWCGCRWRQAVKAARHAVSLYGASDERLGFEIAHTRVVSLFGLFHLGKLDQLMHLVDRMLDDAIHRRDRFSEAVVTFGVGGTAWLARGDREGLRQAGRRLRPPAESGRPDELIDVVRWIGEMQADIHAARWDSAERNLQRGRRVLGQAPYGGIQPFRVQRLIFETLLLARATMGTGPRAPRRGRRRLAHGIARERIPFARVLAALADGLIDLHSGRPDLARDALDQARAAATEQGLRPWELAAEDALTAIDGGVWGDRLREYLERQGIVRPESFERLYTVRTPETPLASDSSGSVV